LARDRVNDLATTLSDQGKQSVNRVALEMVAKGCNAIGAAFNVVKSNT